MPTAGQWTLHGADNNYLGGTLLGDDRPSGDFEPLPTLTGTGLLIISGSATPFGYSVRVVDPVHASGAIVVGTVVSNLLVGAGSEHRLTFTAAPGQRLYFDALDQDWDAVSAGLLGPDGNSQWNSGADSDYGCFTVTQPGTHTLVVHNSTDAAADYRFRLLDLTAQPALTPGVTQSGQLNPRTQAHVYRFSGTNGQRVHLESVAASSGDAYWFIQDPFNTTLAANFINASIGNVFLPIHGTYAVIVSGNGPDSGTLDYQIRLSDVSDAPVAASGLGSFFGNVASGDTNIVYFNASAGAPIYVDSLTNNSSVTLRLSDTHGAVVFEANGSDGAYDPGFHTLPTSGTYTLEIVGSSGGDYAFRILNLNTDALPLTPAAVYAGTLTNGFQTEIFRLPGTNGQRLFYDALEGDFDQVYAALVAPNFNPLFGGVGSWWWWGNNADLDAGPVTLSVSGPHYLIIRSAVAETNHYAFRLLDLFQPPAQAINVGATYGSGLVPVPSSSLVVTGSYVAGNLRFVDEPDWRVTQTIAGTRVDAQINFSNANWGTLSSVGFTEGPNGSDADWENYSVQWDGRITITNTGTRLYLYSDNSSRLWADLNSNGVFEASELLDNQWGMEIGDRSPASAAIAAGVYSIRIQYEETYGQNQMVLLWDNGFNLGPYEAQVFHFTNNAAPFFFDSVQQSPPSWNHYPPGADIAITGQGWLTDFESSASVAGTNVLIIQNQTASGQPYGFRVLTPASATNALTLGTPHSGSLTAGQDHWFTFAGTAGQRLYYDSLNPQFGNMSVRLVAPSGAVLVSDGYYAYDAGPLTLTESGIHRVRLHNNLDTVTAYSFRLLDVAAQPAISLDATNSGPVPLGTMARLFRVDGLARLRLFCDDLGSSHNGAGTWTLFNRADQSVGSNWMPYDFEVTDPLLSGEYLLVLNTTSTNSYDYTFRVVPGNHAPVFTSGNSLTGDEMTVLTFTHTASDLEAPNDQLTFSLEGDIPDGLTLDASTGVMDWTPTEAQGPSTNTFTVRVTDDGIPNLSATRAFTVIVNEVNRAPALTVPGPQVVNELVALNVSASATDPDIPANALTFSLLSPPGGMTINPATGAIAWSPSEAQGPGFYTVTVVVTDTNPPAVNAKQLSATNSFTVTVNEVNVAPVLPVQTNRTINELALLSVTNTATDADLPANVLTYTLENPPTGAVVDTNGVITWTPGEAQGPGVFTLKTIVADNGVPVLRATNSFTVTVNEVNVAPVLPVQTNRTINELTLLTVTNTATDADLPANVLTYTLENPPTGAVVDTNGVITWTPGEAQGPGVYTLKTIVADNGSPQLMATNSFTVTVNEVNVAPVLPAQANRTINELTLLSVTNTATDADLPANVLAYTLENPPTGAVIDANGVIIWTPGEAQGSGVFTLKTIVADNGSPQLMATNSFTVTVNEVNVAPVLPVQTNRTINELALLTVTNTATDADLPANVLAYTLENPPTGAVIDSNGVITWTPSEAQGPGVYTLKTIVADNGVPVLRGTNSFAVTVNEVNIAPVLSAIANRVTNPGQTVTLTASATDADSPPNALTFSLVSAPVGAAINPASGLFTWRPPVSRAGTSNYVQVRVADNGSPSLTDVKEFAILVNSLVPVVLSPLGVAGGEFSANVTSGTIGPDHVLQGSTNLTDWVRLSTNTPTVLPFTLTDPNAGAFPKRFYRVKLEP